MTSTTSQRGNLLRSLSKPRLLVAHGLHAIPSPCPKLHCVGHPSCAFHQVSREQRGPSCIDDSGMASSTLRSSLTGTDNWQLAADPSHGKMFHWRKSLSLLTCVAQLSSCGIDAAQPVVSVCVLLLCAVTCKLSSAAYSTCCYACLDSQHLKAKATLLTDR